MAWTAPKSWTTGYKVLASDMNTFVSDNDAALRAGGLAVTSQAAGDVLYASSSTQLTRLAIGTANKVLTTSGSVPQWSTQIVNAALPTNVDLGGTLDVTGATTLDSTVAAAGAVTVTGTSSGASVAPNSLLVLDHNDNTTLNILSGTGGGGFLDFGDSDLAYAGRITYIHTSNYMSFTANAAERMRITSAGDVGINTTTPLAKLTVTGTASGASAAGSSLLVLDHNDNTTLNILSGTGGGGFIDFGDSGDSDIGRIIYIHSTNYMSFVTNATEKMRITSAGDVGVGTTAPGTAVAADKMVHSVNCVRAWGKVNATSGTPTFVDGFNFTVGAIASPAVGKSLVTFATALPDANYAVVVGFCDNYPKFAVIQSESTTSFEVWTFSSLENLEDLEWTFAVISD